LEAKMGKYSPLRAYLISQNENRIPMTFDEIERLIGAPLPASKKYPAWWSNNPSNNPMTKEWLAAGFQTEEVNIARESVVFSRVSREAVAGELAGFGEGPRAEFKRLTRRHPLFGRLKGVITLAPRVDLTDPPDPELADYLDKKYGPEVRD
jgi:hypothetical protein